MALRWAISDEQGVVAAEVGDDVTPAEIGRFLADLTDRKAMGYRKVFDITLARQSWTLDDIRQLSAAFDRAAGSGPRGAVAIVARSSTARKLADDYRAVSAAQRSIQVFDKSEEAQSWLQSLLDDRSRDPRGRAAALREQAARVRTVAAAMSLSADQAELERQAARLDAEADRLDRGGAA